MPSDAEKAAASLKIKLLHRVNLQESPKYCYLFLTVFHKVYGVSINLTQKTVFFLHVVFLSLFTPCCC